MKGRVFLHVGSPKTGTTFLQAVLWKNKAALRDAGLLLPGRTFNDHFRACLDLREFRSRAANPELVPGSWRRVVDEVAGWHGDALISHEHFVWATQEQAERGVADLEATGKEVHVVLTARDLARQLPAEWQERVKHRSQDTFAEFMDEARTQGSPTYNHLWTAQDYADVHRRWGSFRDNALFHVVTVPGADAPRTLLWERFAGLLGIDPAAYSLDVPRENTSVGLEQAELLRRLNATIGNRLRIPGPYTPVVKGLFAQEVLSARRGTRLRLGGDDLAFARERAAEMVLELRRRRVDVVGDLDELLVPERPDDPAESTARRDLDDEPLLGEMIGATADLLVTVSGRLEAWQTQRGALRDELRKVKAELRETRKRARRAEAERDALAARTVRRRADRALGRARRVGRRVVDRVRHRPRLVFLMFSVDGGGGVARTTVNLANALAETHEVEIISVYTGHKRNFEVDPRVTVTYLVPVPPRRTGFPPALAEKAAQRSVLSVGDKLSALTDERMQRAFARLRPGDVLVSTRPSLHVAAAQLVPDHVIRIGWDHLNFPQRYAESSPGGRSIDRALPKLDALVVLTEADARDYRERHPHARIQVIRNSVGWEPAAVRPPRDSKTVVAAGRLTHIKGFDRLIEAWTSIQDDFPDWRCLIYGHGESRAQLQAQIEEAGSTIQLAGYSTDMPSTLAGADVFVMSSRQEGFPMTLIEAASRGTPMVSFDCPRGPGEIIVDGSNGRLVPDGDVDALAKALADVIRDPAARERMGEQALRDSRQYTADRIAADWRKLVDELVGRRRG